MDTSIFSLKYLPAVRGFRSLAVGLILASGLAGSVQAQSGSAPPPDSRYQGGWGGGHRHGGPPHHGMALMDAAQGPISPAVLRDTIQVSGDELQQYTKKYDSYMASTKPTRDSLRTSLAAVRSAYQRGDREGIEGQRDQVRRQGKDLQKRDADFEKNLKSQLTKDQQKRYDGWKKDQEQSRQQQWKGQHHHGGSDSTDQRPQQ